MAGNPKESPWRSTPASARKRKPMTITLSDEARVQLEAIAEQHNVTMSQAIELLIKAAGAT